jgi:SAM-dependent methyltransferase
LAPETVNHVAGLHAELAAHLGSAGRVLDLGCGANADLAPYRTPGREVWGTDFQPHPALQHPEWFRPLGSGGAIPFPDGHFDLVASVMVLEHVADPAAYFREVARVLRPGGVFVGHTISGTHYVSGIRRAFGLLPHAVNQALVKKLYARDPEDTFPTRYRLNTERAIRRAGAAAGLRLVRLQRYADPGYFRFWAPLERLAARTDRLLDRVRPGWGRLYLTATLVREGV